MSNPPEFQDFPKIARFNRKVVVTEKIDGTNAQVVVSDDGTELWAASRNRYITPQDDNFGFARWVEEHKAELLTLGPGRHYGEWWGPGIGRKYNIKEKRFSLFNTERWGLSRPSCCHVVPILWEGVLGDLDVHDVMAKLAQGGSVAAPGFTRPEGIVVFHTAGGVAFKMTLDANDVSKGLAPAP